jgi:hypothetical protein
MKYLITKDGKVFSYRKTNTGNVYKEIKPQLAKNGYLRVGIYFNKKANIQSVHRLVAESFIPNPKNKPQVNHINGIKTDNRVENLEWVTSSENVKHTFNNLGRIGKGAKGEKGGNSKLTNELVKFIRENYKPRDREYGTRGLGRKLNVGCNTISAIVNNKTWQ